MSRKSKTFFISFIATIVVILSDPEILDIIWDLFESLIANAEKVKSTIGWATTIISIMMYVKLRFYDTKLYNKLQSTYGKKQFLDSLIIILNMLEIMNPEQVLNRIMMISHTETDMRKAICELDRILNLSAVSVKPIQLELSGKEQKELATQIKVLLDLIDKRIEMHYISKDIIKDKLITFNQNIEKSIKIKAKHESYESTVKELGKKRILKDLSK